MITIHIYDQPKPFWEADSEVEVANREAANITLWALALQPIPEYASCMMPGAIERSDNWHLRGQTPPAHFAKAVDEKLAQLRNLCAIAEKIAAKDLIGAHVQFKNWRGEIETDVVREVFEHESLLEPYARNTTETGLVLTRYSWIPLTDAIRFF
jgi:hypothetical protein